MAETCRISPKLALGDSVKEEKDAELSDLAKVTALSGLWAGICLLGALAPSPSQTHQEPLLQPLSDLHAAEHPKSLPGAHAWTLLHQTLGLPGMENCPWAQTWTIL